MKLQKTKFLTMGAVGFWLTTQAVTLGLAHYANSPDLTDLKNYSIIENLSASVYGSIYFGTIGVVAGLFLDGITSKPVKNAIKKFKV